MGEGDASVAAGVHFSNVQNKFSNSYVTFHIAHHVTCLVTCHVTYHVICHAICHLHTFSVIFHVTCYLTISVTSDVSCLTCCVKCQRHSIKSWVFISHKISLLTNGNIHIVSSLYGNICFISTTQLSLARWRHHQQVFPCNPVTLKTSISFFTNI